MCVCVCVCVVVNFVEVGEIDVRKKHVCPCVSMSELKVNVKAVCGSYSTAALRHIVLLPK